MHSIIKITVDVTDMRNSKRPYSSEEEMILMKIVVLSKIQNKQYTSNRISALPFIFTFPLELVKKIPQHKK